MTGVSESSQQSSSLKDEGYICIIVNTDTTSITANYIKIINLISNKNAALFFF
ncbi:hypothetical protein KZ793_05590 [Photorhabdus sp. UCH-936]|nr:hypothetical protein [Photorhabdus antumapuensis]